MQIIKDYISHYMEITKYYSKKVIYLFCLPFEVLQSHNFINKLYSFSKPYIQSQITQGFLFVGGWVDLDMKNHCWI